METAISRVLFESIYEIMKGKITVDQQAFVSTCTEGATAYSMNAVINTIAMNATREQKEQLQSLISIARGKAKLCLLLGLNY
jgi:hypothetical protein